MAFKDIEDWGFVDPKTRVAGSEDNRYVVITQNAAGFIGLKNISGGEDLRFEVLDRIDHGVFREVE